jgi:tetratricopeptide (TPR) repeat protein
MMKSQKGRPMFTIHDSTLETLRFLVLCVLGVSVAGLMRTAQADEVGALVKKAQGFSDAGQYEMALPAWQAVVAKRPQDVEALIETGISASLLGRYDLAHEHLERAIAISPRDPRALLNLGLVCLREKNFPRAEDLFRQTLAADPAYPDANLHLGIMAEERGDFASAKEYYIKEVNIMGGTNRAWGRLMSLQNRSPRRGISSGAAIVFLIVCLAVGGALLAVHRIRTGHWANVPRQCSGHVAQPDRRPHG